jgi:ABC-2 type transport system permease protein
MRKCLTLWRREVTASFASPIGYVLLVIFLVLAGGSLLLGMIANEGRTQSPLGLLFGALGLWTALPVAAVTMRLFAEEKRAGTIETLLTAPVSEAAIVLGKYAAALTAVMAAMLPPVAALAVVAWLSPTLALANLDAGEWLGGCLIVGLQAMCWTAFGVMCSLLSRHQLVAAVCALSGTWLGLYSGWLIADVPGLGDVSTYLSATAHIELFTRGTITVQPVVLYGSATAFLLFAATRILESRRWK